ncbi:MAG TPA: tetratricopeptide repeat protein [Elusimicrobiota bacterium]|nr:tetratricopeptide repeat protein [Elusimicrobiota bacterium]
MSQRRSAALAQSFPGSHAAALQSLLRADSHAAAYAACDRLFGGAPVPAFRSLRDLWLEGEHGDLRRAPSSPWTDFFASSAAWRRGQDLPALELLARAASAPGRSWMRYYVAEILLRRLDLYAAARREIGAVLAADPWLWEARCLNAEIGMALGAPRGADPSSRGVPPASRPAFLAWRGALKLWSGRPSAALADLDAAAALGNLDARGWRGGARLLLGRGAEALADLTAVLDDDPKDPEALVWRGECHRLAGRPELARADLDSALELSESSIWARVNRALLRLDLGDEAGARHDFARLAPARYEDAPDDGTGRDAGRHVFDEPALAPARMREALLSALRAARGCRRFDAHLNAAWMRAAGVPVPERPSPQARLLHWLRAAGLPCPPEVSFGPGAVTGEDAERALRGARRDAANERG